MTTTGLAAAYATTSRPVLLVADRGMAGEAEAAIAQAGCRLLQRIGWDMLPQRLGEPALRPLLMVEAAGVASDLLDAALARLEGYAAALDLPMVVSFAEAQIDQIAALMTQRDALLLCDPVPLERVLALAVAARPGDAFTLGDSLRENEGARLQRLNDEVARIAEILARLARSEAMPSHDAFDLADRHRGYDPGPATGDQRVDPQEVRRVIHLRRLRAKFFDAFGQGLFEDPAWDMLLDLYAAALEGRQVSVSSLCIAAAVAPTTALRWIAKMTDVGLLVRHPDPVDRRRAFMALSPQAAEAMRGYMLAARRVEGAAV